MAAKYISQPKLNILCVGLNEIFPEIPTLNIAMEEANKMCEDFNVKFPISTTWAMNEFKPKERNVVAYAIQVSMLYALLDKLKFPNSIIDIVVESYMKEYKTKESLFKQKYNADWVKINAVMMKFTPELFMLGLKELKENM